MARVIVFTNMKITAEKLEWKLNQNGVKATALTGDVSQSKRQKTIEGIKEGSINVLVATDVAARGIHINDVTHVINYDLPEDAANYVHRIGRTARAGATGVAYSLGCENHVTNLPEIEKFIEAKLEKEWLEDAEIVKDSSGRFIAKRQRTGPSDRGGKTFKKSPSNKPNRSNKPKSSFNKNKPSQVKPKEDKTSKDSVSKEASTSTTKTKTTQSTSENRPKKPFKKNNYSKTNNDKNRPAKTYSKHKEKPKNERKSLDERMELYKNKYEDSSTQTVAKKKGLFGKVLGVFGKKS